jgi:ubiquinone/menaquinone biosynthesis C-methylase UbiE
MSQMDVADHGLALVGERTICTQGCGDPVNWSRLSRGEMVLDLGCGEGRDALAAARLVGSAGLVYGLDRSAEALAAANLAKARQGIANARFLQGDIAKVPLPSNSVDVVISNCVVCLAADRKQVFAEMKRVLKPGGRIAIADLAATRQLPANLLQELAASLGDLSLSIGLTSYADRLREAGFAEVAVREVRAINIAHPRLNRLVFLLPEPELDELQGALVSIYVSAVKAAG